MDNHSVSRESAKVCRGIQKNFGKSYYFATMFFPKDKKTATQVLYSFFRIPDEIVDNPSHTDSKKIKTLLERWEADWKEAYAKGESPDPILDASAKVFKKYGIPYHLSEAFIKAMIMDTEKSRYRNYHELKDYMYGSAAVVGLMMSYIIGFKDKKALEYAEKLGYAMQLTNFLRDIREDYEKRGRIYMPLDEMDRFAISEHDISSKKTTQQFKDFMIFQTNRAKNLYKEAEEGIQYLNKDGRLAVKVASALYGAILCKIEDLDYNIFAKRAHTNILEKIVLLIKEVMKK